MLAEDLERELAQGRQASVILFDIDRFKEINDTYGHFAGDRALVAIARLLRENARDSDTPVRYGGDEFLVLLGGTGTEKARDIAERLRLAIATEPIEHRGVVDPADRQHRRRERESRRAHRAARPHRTRRPRAVRREARWAQLRRHARPLTGAPHGDGAWCAASSSARIPNDEWHPVRQLHSVAQTRGILHGNHRPMIARNAKVVPGEADI